MLGKNARLRIFLLALMTSGGTSSAHADVAPAEEPPIVFQSPSLPALGEDLASTEAQRQFRTRLLLGGAAASVLGYGATHWWQDGMRSSFGTINEGWFGQNTYTGGADKLGHMYSTYVGTRLLTDAFEWAGNEREKAAWLAAATAWGVMLAVEVGDGYSRRFRFSKEDLVMNTLGTGFGMLMEKNPGLDELIDFRLKYWPSEDARRLNQVDPVDDHSGQTYLLVFKASGLPALRKIEPLRYFELAVGYGTRGYEPDAGEDRSRRIYYGISLNVAEILAQTVFRDSKSSRAQRIGNTVLEYLQLPGTAVLADHRL